MASNWLEEGNHAGAFIVSEATEGATGVSRSRDTMIATGPLSLSAGAVLDATTGGATGIVPFENGVSGPANAVLFDNLELEAGETTTVVIIRRDAEVNADELVFGATEDAADIAAGISGLKSAGIIVRETI